MARIKQPEKLKLIELMEQWDLYQGLPDGLVNLPLPRRIKIKKKWWPVPKDVDEFTANLVYGQRMFFTRQEEDDFGIIVRVMDGYYYPIVEKKLWDQDNALIFGKNILTCSVEHLYPVAMHLITLISQMAERERQLLHREPTRLELAAGVENLNKFSELSALDFLRDAMKVTIEEVLLTPYRECLVRFMMQKELDDYRQRYMELAQEKAKAEMESKKKSYARSKG